MVGFLRTKLATTNRTAFSTGVCWSFTPRSGISFMRLATTSRMTWKYAGRAKIVESCPLVALHDYQDLQENRQ